MEVVLLVGNHAWQHRKGKVAAASTQTRDGDSRKARRGRESCGGAIIWGYVCLRITLWPQNRFCSRSLCSFTFHICNFLQEGTMHRLKCPFCPLCVCTTLITRRAGFHLFISGPLASRRLCIKTFLQPSFCLLEMRHKFLALPFNTVFFLQMYVNSQLKTIMYSGMNR